MRTFLRRVLLIFIILVIAFFLYSAIDPQGSSNLISRIKGETGTVITSSSWTTVPSIDLTHTNTSGGVITLPTGEATTARTWSGRRNGTTDNVSEDKSGSTITEFSTGLSSAFLDAVSAPNIFSTGSNTWFIISNSVVSVTSVTLTGVFTTGLTSDITIQRWSSITQTTVVTRTITTTASWSTIQGSEQELTDQFFGNLIEGVVRP